MKSAKRIHDENFLYTFDFVASSRMREKNWNINNMKNWERENITHGEERIRFLEREANSQT